MEFTVDGRKVFAATGGRPFDPGLPSIVFLHGAGMGHTVWALQTRYFAHHGRNVLAVDLPGHGHSEGPALSSIAEMADWTVRLLDVAGVSEAALAGHSMGALVALDCAGRYPQRVRALALLGVAPKMPVHPDLLAAARDNNHLAVDLMSSWGHGPTGHLGGARAPGLWLMMGGKRLLERAAPGVLSSDLKACNAYSDAPQRAASVNCPSRLVLGAMDKMTPPKAGQKLAQSLSGAEVVVIPDCGHMMMTERPDQTLDALKSFL
jgi:pimeloyl-ACP methyl ester carboxylesterase